MKSVLIIAITALTFDIANAQNFATANRDFVIRDGRIGGAGIENKSTYKIHNNGNTFRVTSLAKVGLRDGYTLELRKDKEGKPVRITESAARSDGGLVSITAEIDSEGASSVTACDMTIKNILAYRNQNILPNNYFTCTSVTRKTCQMAIEEFGQTKALDEKLEACYDIATQIKSFAHKLSANRDYREMAERNMKYLKGFQPNSPFAKIEDNLDPSLAGSEGTLRSVFWVKEYMDQCLTYEVAGKKEIVAQDRPRGAATQ